MQYAIEIDLPDLQPDATIRASSIHAMSPVYVAALLEGLRIFDVVDVLVEQFLDGRLPLDRDGASRVDRYLRDFPNRLSEGERHALYAHAFGMPGGGDEAVVNRDFDDLWARFLVAVDEFIGQVTSGPQPGGTPPPQQPAVAQGARELAGNLSRHGTGIGLFAAMALRKEITQLLDLLSTPSLLAAFGARDVWQVIDRVASVELGGALNSRRYRTMALSGAVVIGWLARRADAVAAPAGAAIDLQQLASPPSASPMSAPTDRDLADACRTWLAAVMMGTDQRVMPA